LKAVKKEVDAEKNNVALKASEAKGNRAERVPWEETGWAGETKLARLDVTLAIGGEKARERGVDGKNPNSGAGEGPRRVKTTAGRVVDTQRKAGES